MTTYGVIIKVLSASLARPKSRICVGVRRGGGEGGGEGEGEGEEEEKGRGKK